MCGYSSQFLSTYCVCGARQVFHRGSLPQWALFCMYTCPSYTDEEREAWRNDL